MTEPKPLAVGDRVRVKSLTWADNNDPPVGTELTVIEDRHGSDSDLCTVDWPNPFDGGAKWWRMHKTDLERIDPVSPAGLEPVRECQACDEQLLHTVRTLTAERDAALAQLGGAESELAGLRGELFEILDDVRSEPHDSQARGLAIDRIEELLEDGQPQPKAELAAVTAERDAARAEADAEHARAVEVADKLREERAKRDRLVAALRENLDSYPDAVIGRASLDEIIAESEAAP